MNFESILLNGIGVYFTLESFVYMSENGEVN